MEAIVVHTDCLHYKGHMPCDFHKQDGRLCDACQDYEKTESGGNASGFSIQWESDAAGSQNTGRMSILIVKLAAVGDVLRTTCILPALRSKYPEAGITWITKPNAAPLFEGNTFIDRLVTVEEPQARLTCRRDFDLSICLDADSFSASIHSAAESNARFGFVVDAKGHTQPANERAKEWWYMGLNDSLKRKNRKTYQRIIYEICGLSFPAARPLLFPDEMSMKRAGTFAESREVRRFEKVVGVNTGAGARWQYKRWTMDGYASLIRRLRQKGIGIILYGGPEEVEFNKHLLQCVGGDVIDAGCANTLREFAALLTLPDVVFTPDSLAMHIAVAIEKPVVVSVGPTSPWELDVYGKGEVIHSDIECLACYLSRCNKTTHCMNTLGVDRVYDAIMRHL